MGKLAANILCVGIDSAILESRCFILALEGYRARAATPSEAETLLHNEKFDLHRHGFPHSPRSLPE